MKNKEDEIKNIKEWISKNGYPLEINTAKQFKKNNFQVSQSLLYKDVETGKYREIDVIAHKHKEFKNVSLNISFVIECKKTVGKPWIIFKNDDIINTKYKEFAVYASKNGQKLISKINKSQNKSNLFYPEINNAGYSVVTCFNEKNDLAYNATQAIGNACKHLEFESNKSKKRFCNIYFPIVVIEGKIFSGFLNDDGDIDINDEKWFSVYNTVTFEEDKINWITIISFENLEEFIGEMTKKIENFYIDNSNDINLTLSTYPINNNMQYNIG